MRLFTLAFAAVSLVGVAAAYGQNDTAEPRTAMPTKGLLWGSKMTVESEPCCAPRQGAKAGDPTEAAVLASVSDRALRDGPILKLKLQKNHILKITDCADVDACEAERFRAHRLAAWWPALGYYAVHVGLYEDSMAYLVAEKDGRTTQVAAVPVLSPSGNRSVALVSNLMSGVDLEIIDFSVQPPRVTTVSEMPACAGAGPDSFLRPTPVWVDDSSVRFDGKSPQPGDSPDTKQLLRIVDGKPQWQC